MESSQTTAATVNATSQKPKPTWHNKKRRGTPQHEKQYDNKSNPNKPQPRTQCYNCTGQGLHDGGRVICPAYGTTCIKCGKPNHTASTAFNVNMLTQCNKMLVLVRSPCQTRQWLYIHHQRTGKPQLAKSTGQDSRYRHATMMDSGSSINIIDEAAYQMLWPAEKVIK